VQENLWVVGFEGSDLAGANDRVTDQPVDSGGPPATQPNSRETSFCPSEALSQFVISAKSCEAGREPRSRLGAIQRFFRGETPALEANRIDKELKFQIADMVISFLFDQALSGFGFEESKPDGPSDTHTDMELQVHLGYAPKPNIKNILFDSGQTWAFYQSDGKYVLQNDTLGKDSHLTTVAIMEPDFKSGHLYIAPDRMHEALFSDPLGYPLNQVLMILLLSRRKGVIFHACGIDDDGSGYLFLGHSGDGKSTMAKLWFENRATILNDDRMVIREREGEFWMYGTPWHGDFKEWSPYGMVIRKMFFLCRGSENVAVPKQGAEAVSMMLARAFPPIWDEAGMAYTVDFCHGLVSKVPCYQLNFVPDKAVLEFVRSMG